MTMAYISRKQAAQMVWDALIDVRPNGLDRHELVAKTGLEARDIYRAMSFINTVLQVNYGIPRAWDPRARKYFLPLSLDEGRSSLTSEIKGMMSRSSSLEKRLTAYKMQAIEQGDVEQVAEVQELLTEMSGINRDTRRMHKRIRKVLSGSSSEE